MIDALFKQATQKAIGENLRRARLRKGISQRTLAKQLDSYPHVVINWEYGRKEISAWRLLRVCRILNCDPAVILHSAAQEIDVHIKRARAPFDNRRAYLKRRYQLTEKQTRDLTLPVLEQVLACPTEEARKILLGIQERP